MTSVHSLTGVLLQVWSPVADGTSQLSRTVVANGRIARARAEVLSVSWGSKVDCPACLQEGVLEPSAAPIAYTVLRL